MHKRLLTVRPRPPVAPAVARALEPFVHKLTGPGDERRQTLVRYVVQLAPAASADKRANYIVQGTGGDGLKVALALLWERRDQVPGAFPVLAVHDEIVVECDEGQAEMVAAWLKAAMVDAMAPLIIPVPV